MPCFTAAGRDGVLLPVNKQKNQSEGGERGRIFPSIARLRILPLRWQQRCESRGCSLVLFELQDVGTPPEEAVGLVFSLCSSAAGKRGQREGQRNDGCRRSRMRGYGRGISGRGGAPDPGAGGGQPREDTGGGVRTGGSGGEPEPEAAVRRPGGRAGGAKGGAGAAAGGGVSRGMTPYSKSMH